MGGHKLWGGVFSVFLAHNSLKRIQKNKRDAISSWGGYGKVFSYSNAEFLWLFVLLFAAILSIAAHSFQPTKKYLKISLSQDLFFN